MYKNGGWLTTRTFGTHLGGSSNGGGASPYSKGGNGSYFDLMLIWSYPESAPSYGAGGGGTNPIFKPTDPNCDETKYGTGRKWRKRIYRNFRLRLLNNLYEK